MTHPPVIVVNDHDEPTGIAPLQEVWDKGLVHRIVRVMVEDEQGNLLLQKRSEQMRLAPGRWDHSAAGHVDAGDSYEQAAARELYEELGISGVPLSELAHYYTDTTEDGLRLKRFNKLYRAVVSRETVVRSDPHEVAEVRWFTPDEARQLLRNHPEQATGGLEHVIKEHY